MDACCTHQPIPKPNPELASPAPPAAGLQDEGTGDSENDAPVTSAALAVGDRPRPSVVAAAGYADDDAESCIGAGNNRTPAASVDDDGDDGRGGGVDDVAVDMEGGDESEVDSKMSVPWWSRMMVRDAAAGVGAGGGCARPQASAAAAEGGAAAVVVGASHTAESNRLFWEACIAHGY